MEQITKNITMPSKERFLMSELVEKLNILFASIFNNNQTKNYGAAESAYYYCNTTRIVAVSNFSRQLCKVYTKGLSLPSFLPHSNLLFSKFCFTTVSAAPLLTLILKQLKK